MNRALPITDNIYWVGVNDRETSLFESLWPLPEGVSYNSYLILDDKVALIDTVNISYSETYLEKINSILAGRKIDYLIINHMEPDHSGSIKALKAVYPDIKIIGNNKTINFLKGFYGIDKDTQEVNEGDMLDLGDHKLKFFLTPMIHWPETMMTYYEKDKVLFSGDAFGGFGSLPGGIFDDEIDTDYFEDEIRRYYTNIVAKYSPLVKKTISRLEDLNIRIVASTHGPIWRNNPQYIIDKYKKWSSYEVEKGVVIVYGSMYGNTKKMAEEIARTLAEKGVEKIKLYDVSRTHISYIISDIWNYKGVILGSPTYNTELFPPMAALVRALENRVLKNHLLGIFGSFSWSGGAVKELKEYSENSNLKVVEPIIESKFSPDSDVIKKCWTLGENMAKLILSTD